MQWCSKTCFEVNVKFSDEGERNHYGNFSYVITKT